MVREAGEDGQQEEPSGEAALLREEYDQDEEKRREKPGGRAAGPFPASSYSFRDEIDESATNVVSLPTDSTRPVAKPKLPSGLPTVVFHVQCTLASSACIIHLFPIVPLRRVRFRADVNVFEDTAELDIENEMPPFFEQTSATRLRARWVLGVSRGKGG